MQNSHRKLGKFFEPVTMLTNEFRASFRSMWVLLSSLISAVALFNYITSLMNITLSEFFLQSLGSVKSLLYPVVNVIFCWLPLTDVWRDGIILWFVLGGAVVRTTLSLLANIADENDTTGIGSLLSGGIGTFGALDHLNMHRRTRALWFAFSFLFWPVMLGLLWKRPLIFRQQAYDFLDEGGTLCTTYSAEKAETPRAEYERPWGKRRKLHLDVRVVFAIQLAAVVLAVVLMMLANEAGLA